MWFIVSAHQGEVISSQKGATGSKQGGLRIGDRVPENWDGPSIWGLRSPTGKFDKGAYRFHKKSSFVEEDYGNPNRRPQLQTAF